MSFALRCRVLGLVPYPECYRRMRDFVERRGAGTIDEMWFVEHAPVFTQGMAGRDEHVLRPGDIAVVRTDRGGQVTYHGPGQMVVYVLLDLARRRLGVRRLVESLEGAVIGLLREYGIEASGDRAAPGVYVGGAKIAAIGLRVRRRSSYHGLSLNVDMDLSPFRRINPCGYADLRVTSMRELGVGASMDDIRARLYYHLCLTLDYDTDLT